MDVRPGVFVPPAWWKSSTLGLPTGGLSLALSRRHELPNRGARRGACPESRRHSVSSALRKARLDHVLITLALLGAGEAV